MEKLLKSKSGVAAILVIIILVVAVGAGGATVLAVRMVVTGEDYLQPFVDLGLISEDAISDDEEVEETIATSGRLIELSSDVEAKISAKGVTHYEIKVDTEKLLSTCIDIMSNIYDASDSLMGSDSYSSSSTVDDIASNIIDILDYYTSIVDEVEFVADIYVDGNDILEVVLYTDYGDLLEVFYEMLEEEDPDELESEGIESYDDFLDYISSYLDEDEVADYVIDAILEEYGDYIDYTEKELKELITFKWDTKNNKLELAIEIPDEINEYLADFVDEYWDELVDELEEYEPYMSLLESYYGISISYDSSLLDKDEYVGSMIYFCEDLVNSLEDGILTVTEK